MKCRICGNEEGNITYFVKEMMWGGVEEFPYFLCRNCNCLQIEKIPANIEKYYKNDYYSFRFTSLKNNIRELIWLKRNQLSLMNQFSIAGAIGWLIKPATSVGQYSVLRPYARSGILDVGCGSGEYIDRLKKTGFRDLCGCDLFIENSFVTEAGNRIIKGTIYDVTGQFNIITFHHSFEHMDGQAEVLAAVKKRLNKRGVCIIRIPVLGYAWEKYGTSWVQIDAPRHYYLHSVKSMKILCERTGLFIDRVYYDSSDFQFRGSEMYSRGILLKDSDRYKKQLSHKQIRNYKKLAAELNKQERGDQAIFILKARDHQSECERTE